MKPEDILIYLKANLNQIISTITDQYQIFIVFCKQDRVNPNFY